MSELILHHYAMSPFAEKVRLILGFKQLAWRSVLIPPVMPKPDVIALTGGYRKTPMLQIGADIYCDTALIARVLEALRPTPTLYPVDVPLAVPLAQWADSYLFQVAVVWAMQPTGAPTILAGISPDQLKVFATDRAAMRANSNSPRPTLADGTSQLKGHLSAINTQLSRGGPWLFGVAPCIADFSVAHCLWFIRRAHPVASVLDEYRAIGPWLDRVLAIAHHAHGEMSSTEAIVAAAAASSHAPAAVAAGQGFESGEAVTVAATDYGTDPVAGTLVGLSDVESVVRTRRCARRHGACTLPPLWLPD
jgi:glutathione S-transferase